MRSCASLLSIGLLLSACAEQGGDHGFQFRSAELTPGFDQLEVHLQQDLRLSPEAIEALENGVPLVVLFAMEIRSSETLTLLADASDAYEIRYLPLSQHYQLTGPGQTDLTIYPRLRHVLSELSSRRFTIQTGPLFEGEYTFRGRVLLDQASLPGPMQLPAALSANWRHDSRWSQWQFQVNV
jgi:hypothetical protein